MLAPPPSRTDHEVPLPLAGEGRVRVRVPPLLGKEGSFSPPLSRRVAQQVTGRCGVVAVLGRDLFLDSRRPTHRIVGLRNPLSPTSLFYDLPWRPWR
jgi:hypothetical protein